MSVEQSTSEKQDRKARLQKKLEQTKAALRKLESREAEEARRKRTRQQIVIGAELQRMASAGLRVRFNGPVESILATVIIKIVLAGLTRPQDRALFGLPPLAEGANPVAVMAEADEELSALLLEIRPGAGLAGA
ncbi:hypothetical protein SAMN05428997_1595 [Bosea sp. CRIB-10]|jgi:head-tail adaptor|uniref:hypothetical protein n=1 Tax=Bosea sp. CRIB-10 TaxID=378404 RepID=UPI00086EB01D|nr:hypothetical protein [Bosea sp. CRIB-10]ODT25833.1 MAG: hypothetical protein ABS54_08145 [Hyphomicrobium sp. SCN 65-11]SFD78462.1 hypothetical protein SAMN05428997_1595 [Bosea sp. CRIB-10]